MHKTLAGERLLTEIETARLNHQRGAQHPSELIDLRASLNRHQRIHC